MCGVPLYDASVPKGRLYGRYLTHVWVWINTVSFAIRDSMCGFRVYPLPPVLRLIDDLPLQNGLPTAPEDIAPARHTTAPSAQSEPATGWQWWQTRSAALWQGLREEAGSLLRVSTISGPEAALLSPEEGVFLRENLKLQLLNARLAILGRQYSAAITDLAAVQASLGKYFVTKARRTEGAKTTLIQLQEQLRTSQQPSLDDTLTALANATAIQE